MARKKAALGGEWRSGCFSYPSRRLWKHCLSPASCKCAHALAHPRDCLPINRVTTSLNTNRPLQFTAQICAASADRCSGSSASECSRVSGQSVERFAVRRGRRTENRVVLNTTHSLTHSLTRFEWGPSFPPSLPFPLRPFPKAANLRHIKFSGPEMKMSAEQISYNPTLYSQSHASLPFTRISQQPSTRFRRRTNVAGTYRPHSPGGSTFRHQPLQGLPPSPPLSFGLLSVWRHFTYTNNT